MIDVLQEKSHSKIQDIIMTEENSWKSREDDEDDELDETVRTIDTYFQQVQAHSLVL